jgi:hypothetical protein
MSMGAIVAWVMFALLIGWIGTVLYATFRTLDGEVRAASEQYEDEGRALDG